MDLEAWLYAAQQQLTKANIATARLDALILLEAVTGYDRAKLLAHPDWNVSGDQQNVLAAFLERRIQHEPLAYVLGKSEFYGRSFVVGPAVLVPRPESETIIDVLKSWADNDYASTPSPAHGKLPSKFEQLTIVDVGTGSGALAVTAALELPNSRVIGLDIDPKCLEVAAQNATLHDVKITLAQSDLLDGLPSLSDSASYLLLCNLPYVPESYPVNRAAQHEPRLALYGGADGLDMYRRLFEQLSVVRNRPLLIVTESLLDQHAALRSIAERSGYYQSEDDDFIQAFQSLI